MIQSISMLTFDAYEPQEKKYGMFSYLLHLDRIKIYISSGVSV